MWMDEMGWLDAMRYFLLLRPFFYFLVVVRVFCTSFLPVCGAISWIGWKVGWIGWGLGWMDGGVNGGVYMDDMEDGGWGRGDVVSYHERLDRRALFV